MVDYTGLQNQRRSDGEDGTAGENLADVYAMAGAMVYIFMHLNSLQVVIALACIFPAGTTAGH